MNRLLKIIKNKRLKYNNNIIQQLNKIKIYNHNCYYYNNNSININNNLNNIIIDNKY